MRRLISFALLAIATTATAQTTQPARVASTGSVASSAVGTAGQRQTREQATLNVAPMGRIAGRIGNRVQSRIRNRIDRYYSPQANAASPFIVAGEQARTTVRTTRR